MKLGILAAASVAALAMAAPAKAYVSDEVMACFMAVDRQLDKGGQFDGFLPTEFFDIARVLFWTGPYDANTREKVATVIMLEGLARYRDDHTKTDEATIKCGMWEGKVVKAELLKGHGIPDPEPKEE